MTTLRVMLSRALAMFRKRQRDAQLSDEIQTHLDLLTQDHVRRGMSLNEARAAARREFGGVDQIKERYRDQRSLPVIDALLQDVRYGIRMLRKSPGFTLAAVLSLGLGIGANTAIFTVIDALLFKPLPIEAPDELVRFTDTFSSGTNVEFSYPLYQDFTARGELFAGIAASGGAPRMRMTVGGQGLSPVTDSVQAQRVSGNFFSVLGMKPIIGRMFAPDDDRPGNPRPVSVISYGLWTRRFGQDPGVIGRHITLDDVPFTIVGVAPPKFFGVEVGASPDLWWPLQMLPRVTVRPEILNSRTSESLLLVGRLRAGVTAARAEPEMHAVFRRDLDERFRQRAARLGSAFTPAAREAFATRSLRLVPGGTGWTFLRAQFQEPLLVLMAFVCLVLLIACANVANLLLARAAARRKEIMMRVALGAGRGRLIRQLLTESLLLAGAGGVLGLMLSRVGTDFLLAYLPSREIVLDVSADTRILGFALAVSVATGLLFGLFPALKATRSDLTSGIKDQPGGRAGRSRSADVLVVSQVALSILLLIGAGLFGRTLRNLHGLDMGFDRDSLMVFSLAIPTDYDSIRRGALYRDVVDRLGATSGVRSASFSAFGVLSGSNWGNRVTVVGYTPRPEENLSARGVIVGPGFFKTMGTRVVLGRDFGLRDIAGSPEVAVVNETFGRRFFAGGNPIGGRFALPGRPNQTFEIVGVVADAKYRMVREPALPDFYVPYEQTAASAEFAGMPMFEVRLPGNAVALPDVIRRVISDLEPRAQVVDAQTMDEVVDASLAQERLVAQLTTVLSVFAALLAAIGLYGVRAYLVARRTHEIGIRMALGAERADVFWMVLRGSLALVAIGTAIGVPLALAASRAVESLLFGLRPSDPVTILAAVGVIVTVGAIAGFFPARRAARVDPLVALRHE